MLRTAASFALLASALSAQVCRTQNLAWPDPQADARVGYSIARHADTLAAGGPYTDAGIGLGGAVYVWRQQNGTWALEQRLGTPAGFGHGTVFGRALSLHGDRLVAGGNPGLNAAWLYRRTGAQWAPGGAIPPSGSTYAINFGHAVAVDGDHIAVAAPQAPGAAPLTVRTGAVFLFRDQGGVVAEVGQLRPALLQGPDDLGIGVAMRSSVLAVGSAIGTQSPSTGAGAAFVYRVANGQAVLEATLHSPAASPGRSSLGATFGQTVATDGVRVAVADVAEADLAAQTGAVHIWVHQGGSWVYEARVVGRPNSCGFGSRVAIDGDALIVGQSCGQRVSHFRRAAGAWTEQGITPVQDASSFLLSDLALSGLDLAIGSALNPGLPAAAGQVGVYRLGSGSMPYGTGLAGSGSLMPDLFGTGCPRLAQPFSVDLARGIGGAPALLVIGVQQGQVPLFGGTLWVSGIGVTSAMVLTGNTGQAGAGGFQFPLTIQGANLLGLRLYFQAGVLDAGAAQGLALTNALEVVVGA